MTTGQVYRFVNEMEPGDYVLTPFRGTRSVLIGKLQGSFKLESGVF